MHRLLVVSQIGVQQPTIDLTTDLTAESETPGSLAC